MSNSTYQLKIHTHTHISKYNMIYIYVLIKMNIKEINRCVVFILQAWDILVVERRHLYISVHRVHVKLPYRSPLIHVVVFTHS